MGKCVTRQEGEEGTPYLGFAEVSPLCLPLLGCCDTMVAKSAKYGIFFLSDDVCCQLYAQGGGGHVVSIGNWLEHWLSQLNDRTA